VAAQYLLSLVDVPADVSDVDYEHRKIAMLLIADGLEALNSISRDVATLRGAYVQQ
jgi:hypothetical protein